MIANCSGRPSSRTGPLPSLHVRRGEVGRNIRSTLASIPSAQPRRAARPSCTIASDASLGVMIAARLFARVSIRIVTWPTPCRARCGPRLPRSDYSGGGWSARNVACARAVMAATNIPIPETMYPIVKILPSVVWGARSP